MQVVIHPPPAGSGFPSVDDLARRFFGRPLEPEEWGSLTGAPDGASMDVTSERAEHGQVVQLGVLHPWYQGPSFRLVYADAQGHTSVRNEYLRVRDEALSPIVIMSAAGPVRLTVTFD